MTSPIPTSVQELPKKLFKYRSMESLGNDRLFEANEIYFSRPSELNDPFECRPVLTADLRPADMRDYQRYLKKKHAPSIGFVEWQKIRSKAARRLSNPETRREIHNHIVEQSGFFCLSAVNDSLLMWAHYSDNHRGFCLEFDTGDDACGYFNDSWPVWYLENRPEVSVTREPERDQLVEVLNSTYLSKAKDWSYEQEFRKISFENPGVQQFPEKALSGVILGCRMAEDSKESVCRMALSRRTPLTIYQAVMDDARYSLSIELLSTEPA